MRDITIAELQEAVTHGESSTQEFKEKCPAPDKFAKEIVALLNSQGGRIFIGVDDEGNIKGVLESAKKLEEKVMNICRENVIPAIIPHWQTLRVDGKLIAIISLPHNASEKPYEVRRGRKKFIRAGTTSREATREEEGRLFSTSAIGIRYENRAVANTGTVDLDERRLDEYFHKLRKLPLPEEESDERLQVLHNMEIIHREQEIPLLTVAGLLLFGKTPHRRQGNYGIVASAYEGSDKSSSLRDNLLLDAPMVRLNDAKGDILEEGIIEQAITFVKRNIHVKEEQVQGARKTDWEYPLDAVREALVNAVVHRDYTLPAEIQLSIYNDRLEIMSPGSLPNSMTVERMKLGVRAMRNELISNVMRDYNYVEGTGMGVLYKIIPRMKEHNGTEPDFILENNFLTVRLWR